MTRKRKYIDKKIFVTLRMKKPVNIFEANSLFAFLRKSNKSKNQKRLSTNGTGPTQIWEIHFPPKRSKKNGVENTVKLMKSSVQSSTLTFGLFDKKAWCILSRVMKVGNILQIHAEYSSAQISGENSSVQDIFYKLSKAFSIQSMKISTAPLQKSHLKKFFFGFKFLLRNKQIENVASSFDGVFVHNIIPFFPARSLLRIGKRTKLFLFWHNNRRFCIKGTNFREGKNCFACKPENHYLAGILHRCYRNSYSQSLLVSLSENMMRRIVKLNTTKHVVFSEYYSRLLKKQGVLESNIFLVPHSVPKVEMLLSQKVEERDFLSVGRIDREKGFRELIEAWKMLDESITQNRKLHIVGDGEELEYLKSYAPDNVEFYGMKKFDEIALISKVCRFAVVPSQCVESFGRVVAEFYSLNMPVISTPQGALKDLVNLLDGKLLSSSISPVDLKVAIEKAIERDIDYKNRPIEIFESYFSEQIWLEKMSGIINEQIQK